MWPLLLYFNVYFNLNFFTKIIWLLKNALLFFNLNNIPTEIVWPWRLAAVGVWAGANAGLMALNGTKLQAFIEEEIS